MLDVHYSSLLVNHRLLSSELNENLQSTLLDQVELAVGARGSRERHQGILNQACQYAILIMR